VIVQVDGQDVGDTSLPELRNLIFGEIGTFVTLKFERDTGEGDPKEFSVSLMRGDANYFAELRRKNQLQVDFDNAQFSLEELRKQVEAMEMDDREIQARTAEDKQNLERLRALLRNAEEQLAKEEATLNQEGRMRAELEAESKRLRDKKGQEERQLEELRALLQQSHNKLTDANDHIQNTRKAKADTERMLKDEQDKRVSSEQRDRELADQLEKMLEEDRRTQQQREQELLEIEEDRKKYEKLLREVQQQTEDVVRKKDVIQARTEKADSHRSKIQQDNDRLITMLHDAEDARATIEQARSEAQTKNMQLEGEIQTLEEQGKSRQQYVEDLRQKAESERARWEQALRAEQDGRREDNQRYRAREEELHKQTPKLAEDMRRYKDEMEDKRRKIESTVMRTEQENKSVEAALKAEESLSEALRERISVLTDQLAKSEDDLNQAKEELNQSEARLQAAETEKLKALERERAMDAEVQKEKDSEKDKVQAIEDLKKKLEDQRFAKEQELYSTISEERKEALAKDEAEHSLRRYRDDGQRMIDEERRRLEREAAFKKSHSEYCEQLDESIKTQEDVKRALDGMTLPTKELAKYLEEDFVFPDTAPRVAKLPDAVDGPPPPMMQSAPMPMAEVPMRPVIVGPPMSHTGYLNQPAYSTGRSMDNGSYI